MTDAPSTTSGQQTTPRYLTARSAQSHSSTTANSSMRAFRFVAVVALAAAGSAPAHAQARRGAVAPFSVVEASIDDMRKALEQKRTTSREIVQQYLTRIALYDHRLNAIIAVNPNALAEA